MFFFSSPISLQAHTSCSQQIAPLTFNKKDIGIIKIENENSFIEINFRVLDKFLSSLENNNKSYPELDLILLKNKPNISIQKKSTYLSNKFKKTKK